MPESESIIAFRNDDVEITNTKDMESNESPKSKRTRLTFPFGACRVCSDFATGIHYGIATCEGCKGFFKRSILRKEKYRCYFDNKCLINVTNRNRCKACRFSRCIEGGMSVDGVKMGRIPKLVKERALKELKEQQMKEEATLAGTNEAPGRESSCSSISDRSVENYDPNAMETNYVESQVSPIQRHGNITNTHINDNFEKKLPINSPIYTDQPPILADIHHSLVDSSFPEHKNSINTTIQSTLNSREQGNTQITFRTKYPTFLPDDFTADETAGVSVQSTGLLTDDVFNHVKTIANKLSATQSNLTVELNEDETAFIRYLRWATYNIFLRRSKPAKQLVARMNKMIENNIQEYPGGNATPEEFFDSIRLSCQVYTRSTVVYVQELPGMKNISLKSLEKIIFRRAFDWFMLRHHELYNDNGQCYFLAPNGFQFTRSWMHHMHGMELTNEIFLFCQRLHELDISETEFALVLPLHLCYHDTNVENEEILQMLRSCYLYALYAELCENRGETEGKRVCSKILQLLEYLIPLSELYEKESATRAFEV